MKTLAKTIWKQAATMTLLTAMTLGCGQVQPMDGGDEDLAQAFADDSDKTDAVKQTKLVDNIGPDSSVKGTFDRKVRVYGYVVEAKRGAKLAIKLDAKAAADAERDDKSAPLDTMMGVWGPFKSVKEPGPQLVMHEDGDTAAAPPIALDIAEDGKYLIAFSSWEDTGAGQYQLDVGCTGTQFQCRRPETASNCVKETLFLQGAQITGHTTWDRCEVVLLEPTTVAADAILTIKPGVVVKGNFLGQPPFGNVTLRVDGAIQAVGTPAAPIAFTSLKPDAGWGGLVLAGRSSSLENVFIEKAGVGVRLLDNASATMTDVVLEGFPPGHPQTLTGIGVVGGVDSEAKFTRALVHHYDIGLHLANARNIVVDDSVVRDNRTGVRIDGANPTNGCANPSPPPAVWRDPVFTHSDIVKNLERGIWVRGEDVLLQVEKSNIIGNGGAAIEIHGAALNPASFIRNSNIFGNNKSNPNQIVSVHRPGGGTLDISGNHWIHISDPELSNGWSMACGGAFTFTGFSPVKISDAGPRLDKLTDPVKQETFQQSN